MADPAGGTTPPRGYPRLTKWAGIFITACLVIVILAQLYDRFGPPTLPDCDANRVQDTLRDLLTDKTPSKLTDMREFAAGAKSDDTLACTATLTFADKTRGRLSYRVYIKDRSLMVATEGLKPL